MTYNPISGPIGRLFPHPARQPEKDRRRRSTTGQPPTTEMLTDLPAHPVRHFWPLRNQRFFCSRLRSRLLVERLGMQTRLTPLAFAAASFLAEQKPASAATRRGVRPSIA